MAAFGLGRVHRAAHALHIGHGASDVLGRDFEAEIVVWLQQHVRRLHQPLSDRTVRRLPEVAALGVLEMRASRDQSDLHVGQRRAGQHAGVLALKDVREDQALPVQREVVGGHRGHGANAAAALAGLHQKLHLGIVTQRLEMPLPQHRRGDSLAVDDVSRAKRHIPAKAVGDQPLQDFQLNGAHEPHMDLPQPLVPYKLEHRVLVLQLAQPRQRGVGIHAVRQHQLIGQHRLQKRLLRLRRRAEGLSRPRVRQTGHGCDRARRQRVRRGEFLAGVQPQLVDFFLIGLAVDGIGQRRLGAQRPARDAQPGEPRALRVAADLEYPCAEFTVVFRNRRVSCQSVEQRLHAVELQRRTEEHGKQLALTDEAGERRIVETAVFQKLLQCRFVAHGGVLVAVGGGEIDAAGQRLRELRHECRAVRAREVELVDKEKCRYTIAFQQPQQRPRMALHTVGAADDEDGAVQHGQRAFHLGGEVHMSGCIQQGKMSILHRKKRGFAKDRDAAFAFQSVGVEEGVAVVDATQRAPCAGGIEQRLG